MKDDTPVQEEYTIGIFHPEDAEGIAALFRSVYGEGYPVKLVYNPPELVAAFNARENIPIVARTREGRIVAHVALYRSAPGPGIFEAGQGLVHADFRGSGVNTRINEYAFNVAPQDLQMEAIFGESVCNHVFMQKTMSRLQTVETAIEVDLMPAEAYAAEGTATGRVATLLIFRSYREREQTVYLPVPYVEQLRFIYGALPETHDLRTANRPLPSEPSRLDVQVFDFARVARVTVWEAGKDFETILMEKEEALAGRGVIVYQVWLNLAWPFTGAAVAVLRRRGYFFGGLLPRWFGTDGLLMQKVTQEPNWEGIRLFSDRAGTILRFVRNDWSETKSGV